MKINDHVINVCKIGQGAKCCRHLMAGAEGLECALHEAGPPSGLAVETIVTMIDSRVALGEMNAKGINCEGKPKTDLNNED